MKGYVKRQLLERYYLAAFGHILCGFLFAYCLSPPTLKADFALIVVVSVHFVLACLSAYETEEALQRPATSYGHALRLHMSQRWQSFIALSAREYLLALVLVMIDIPAVQFMALGLGLATVYGNWAQYKIGLEGYI